MEPQDDSRLSRSYWGLARTLVANMVTGSTDGFTRVLELVGTGYKVEAKGDILVFNMGYSNPVEFPLPKGITAKVEKANRIEFYGRQQGSAGTDGGGDSAGSGHPTRIKARGSGMPAK